MSSGVKTIWWWVGILALAIFLPYILPYWICLLVYFMYGWVTSVFGFHAFPFLYKLKR